MQVAYPRLEYAILRGVRGPTNFLARVRIFSESIFFSSHTRARAQLYVHIARMGNLPLPVSLLVVPDWVRRHKVYECLSLVLG